MTEDEMDKLFGRSPSGRDFSTRAKARRQAAERMDAFLAQFDSSLKPDRPNDTPTVRDFTQNTDLSTPARLKRLESIPPAETNRRRGESQKEENDMNNINRQWGSRHLERFYFEQGDIWIKADGTAVEITEMDRTHALNSLLMLERMADQLAIKGQLQTQKLYVALYNRITDDFPSVAPTPKIDRAWDKIATTSSDIKRALEYAKNSVMEAHKIVWIDYYSVVTGKTTTGRRIKVLDVYKQGDRHYVAAYVDDLGSRTFLLDGITKVVRNI